MFDLLVRIDTHTTYLPGRSPFDARLLMAPHLAKVELDFVGDLFRRGVAPKDVHAKLVARRNRRGVAAPTLRNMRKHLKGETYRRSTVETRGRKKKLTRRNAQALDRARKALNKKSAGQKEVHWDDVIKAARVPSVHSSTAKRAMQQAGMDVAWRHPREKPLRTEKSKCSRVRICKDWEKQPMSFFTKSIDIFMDNKVFPIPTTVAAKAHLNSTKVRGHLRTRAEGLQPEHTKPNNKRHKINPGASVNVCAGIINSQVKLWHYLPSRWNGEVAEATYRGPVLAALKKTCGAKRSFSILEDNDRAGYKSRKAITAKEEVRIVPIDYPTYSPDLNVLDYFLWSEVERRMAKSRVTKIETAEEYKKRLRRTAMAIPRAVIQRAIRGMKKRAAAVVKAAGNSISMD